jgi:peptidoglycan-N-acetylglucosamine deacetylase
MPARRSVAYTALSVVAVLATSAGVTATSGATPPAALVGAASPMVPVSASGPTTASPASRRGTVYLTFDDGPSPYTDRVLRVLTQHHATATFFELGAQQERYPAVAARVRSQGSRIGNHTYDHRNLTTLTATGVRNEIARGPAAVCVRPPYGATDALVRRVIADRHQRQVLWTVDPQDWARPGAAAIRARVLAGARAGSIVLLHDGGGDRSQTLAALPGILDELARRGYAVAALPYC